jgi:hypothetical protein
MDLAPKGYIPMAHAPIVQDRTARRVTKALGICDRQECELLDNGLWRVRDTQTGSGRWHIADSNSCDCYDSTKGTCKHQLAIRAEEQALAQYCATWNARSEQARAAVSTTVENTEIIQSIAPRCPDCGADLVSQSYHVGGRGMVAFLVCSKDVEHKARPA